MLNRELVNRKSVNLKLLNRQSVVHAFFIALFVLSAGLSSQTFAEQPAIVNINTASAEEIATVLKGVGSKRAEAIVSYRKANGKFTMLEDLLQVKGVGEAVLKKNTEVIKLQ